MNFAIKKTSIKGRNRWPELCDQGRQHEFALPAADADYRPWPFEANPNGRWPSDLVISDQLA